MAETVPQTQVHAFRGVVTDDIGTEVAYAAQAIVFGNSSVFLWIGLPGAGSPPTLDSLTIALPFRGDPTSTEVLRSADDGRSVQEAALSKRLCKRLDNTVVYVSLGIPESTPPLTLARIEAGISKKLSEILQSRKVEDKDGVAEGGGGE